MYTRMRSQLIDITTEVDQALAGLGAGDGVCHVFVPHTTAAVTVNENADLTVARDLITFLERMVPWDGDYTHGEGNSAAHIRAGLLGATVTVPVVAGRLALGTWQGILFAEFDGPRSRQIVVSFIPSPSPER
ncbi:MAG: secondary thiamine-phosphate synthase enzyme YjbQ [Anaerolineae bacterium]